MLRHGKAKQPLLVYYGMVSLVTIDFTTAVSEDDPISFSHCGAKQLFGALYIENIQHRAVLRRLARASSHCPCQDTFKFFQVGELGSDVFEMMRGNLADFAARGLFRASQPEQSADFVERKPEIARPPYEGEGSKVG
jgi:hypothetical protein